MTSLKFQIVYSYPPPPAPLWACSPSPRPSPSDKVTERELTDAFSKFGRARPHPLAPPAHARTRARARAPGGSLSGPGRGADVFDSEELTS